MKAPVELAAVVGDRELEPFIEMFVAAWEGRRQLGIDLVDLRTNGRRLDAILQWSVPVTNDRPDYSRVIVTVADLTPRVEAEERLAAALASNQLLMSHEKAIATCSRALLLGAGDEGLNLALDTLRAAIGTGTAYLTRNLDDPRLGLCLQVTAASEAGSSLPREEVGSIEPWTDWPDELASLSNGAAYQEIVDTDENGGRVARLGVPILAGDPVAGCVQTRGSQPNRLAR